MPTPLYDDGAGRQVYHGDCRAILPLLTFDVIVTDPPYGINDVHQDGTMFGQSLANAGPNKKYKRCLGDNQPLDIRWLLEFGKRVLIFGAQYFVHGVPSGGRFIIWDKRLHFPRNNWSDCDVIWDSKPGPCRIIRHMSAGSINDGYGDISKIHPYQKPIKVMRELLLETEGVIADPYMGVGSTLRAAKDLGRACVGIELDEEYCNDAARRLRQQMLMAV